MEEIEKWNTITSSIITDENGYDEFPSFNEEAYSEWVVIHLKDSDETLIARFNLECISSDGHYLDTEGWETPSGKTYSLDKVDRWRNLNDKEQADGSNREEL